jgi:hypothetical protein
MSDQIGTIQIMTNVQLTARNATAEDLVGVLQAQNAHKLDVVVPAINMRSQDGLIQVKGTEPVLSASGVTSTIGTYRPTEVFDEGLAAKLEIPRQYLRKLRERGRTDLIDGNVNGLLRGKVAPVQPGSQPSERVVIHEPDPRAFLLRLFRGEDGDEGVARAMLSDRYGITMDNLDMLMAVMAGIRDAGVQPLVRVTDLSERAMRVRFEFPEINTLAPNLINGYVSPFDRGAKRAGTFDELRQQYGAHHMFSDKDSPVAYMGIDFRNSETGGGAYTLDPVIGIVRCTNGWVQRKEGIRKVHLGARLEQGLIRASAETARRAGALVSSETTDAVGTWLTTGYLERLVRGVEEKAAVAIDTPSETVPAICQGLGFSEEERKGVLDMFILSGQPTAGGLAQAVSAFAQTVEDVDRAYEIELATMPALDKAAAA